MRKHLLFFSFCILPFVVTAQDWRWAKKGGSMDQNPTNPPEEEVYDMATDPNGNLYVLSLVNEGSANVAGMNKTTYGSSDWMVSSFKCDGSLRWAKVIGGPKGDDPRAIAVDKSGGVYVSGYIYLSGGGNFVGNIDADATIPKTDKTMYLIKYDTSGNYQWHRTPQSDTVTPASMPYTVSVDMSVESDGSLHWFCQLPKGEFGGVGGLGVNTLGEYILKYDAAGTFQGGFQMDMLYGGTTAGYARMARNPDNGRYYIAGQWVNTTGSVKVGNTTLTGSMYVACFDNTGKAIWHRQNTDNNDWQPGFRGRPVLDDAGNVYVTGFGHPEGLGKQATVFNGFTVQGTNSDSRPLVAAMDAEGNSLWTTAAIDVNNSSVATNIIVRNSGEVWAIGRFVGVLKWPYYDVSYNLPNAYKTFITRFNTQTGKVLGMDTIVANGLNRAYPTAIAADGRSNVFVGGKFDGSVTKGGNTVTITGGKYDWYTAKYGYNCNCKEIPEPKFTFTRVGDKQVNFTYTGTGQTSIVWDFGDGNTSTQTSPNHTYASNSYYIPCVRVSNACGDNIYCQNVPLWPVGTKELQTATGEVRIYPNPANEQLTVEGAKEEMKLIILNTLGQPVYSGVLNSNREVVDISKLVPGSYTLQLTDTDGSKNMVKFEKL